MELTNLTTSHIPHLISTNSFELNVSDSADSGLAISGSLSSGSDSRQVDRFELIESDADVSQLDSLDGSDGGMSAENFNTLKKVVIATIEPPPEFADSPHTTLIRSPHIQNYANHVAKKILTNALTCYTFLPKFEIQKRLREELRREQEEEEEISRDADGNYFVSKPEPIYNENIYDTGGEAAKATFVLNLRATACSKKIVDREKVEIDEEPTYDVPANYEDEASAETVWRSDKLNTNSTPRSKLFDGATSEIYDYDLYYNLKPTSSFDRRCTPPHCHKLYHYHQNSNMSTANRPNSRNSLNSRLSSSHNSLNVSTSNKVDDSIFITQAMSHDALMVHDISDFYNVPFDSDMYSLPIDMVKTSKIYDQPVNSKSSSFSLFKNPHRITASSFSSFDKIDKIRISGGRGQQSNHQQHHHHCMKLKNTRNVKKRKRTTNTNSSSANINNNNNNNNDVYEPEKSNAGWNCKNAGISHSVNNNNNISSLNNNFEKLYKCTKPSRYFCMTLGGSGAPHTKSAPQTNSVSALGINSGGCTNNNNEKRCSESLMSDLGTAGVIYSTSSESNETLHVKNYPAAAANTSARSKTGTASVVASSKTDTNCQYGGTTKGTTKVVKGQNYGAKEKKCAPGKEETSLTHNNNNNNNAKYGSTTAQKTNKKSQFSINLNLKQKFCSMFRFRRSHHQVAQTTDSNQPQAVDANGIYGLNGSLAKGPDDGKLPKFSSRALPPLPGKKSTDPMPVLVEPKIAEPKDEPKDANSDFPASIQKVKEYGWYWGPISSESAEKILSNEPDGSFIVRDSSDDHYIFALSFKLNGYIRHVRIEQDKGTFSFGSYAKFQSRTIMEFIEKAVEHSRDGRYLFFMQRRPEYGPLRVQLTNPVSRFKHVQSLQHMCRFVILKAVVRFDLAETLPLPRRMLDYLCNKNCLSEQIESDSSSQSQIYGDNPASS